MLPRIGHGDHLEFKTSTISAAGHIYAGELHTSLAFRVQNTRRTLSLHKILASVSSPDSQLGFIEPGRKLVKFSFFLFGNDP
jgi:hypothetical protein